MTPVVVRRSAVKMWLLAILAVPFVLYGADVLLRQRFVGRVLQLIHPNGEIPGVETRDIIWAWVFVLVGGAIALWALKELTLPRKLIEADDTALALRLGGPLSPPVVIPWAEVDEVRAARASDDGDVFPVLVVAFRDGAGVAGLPRTPWGARWIDRGRLAIAAREWDGPAARVADALEALRHRGRTTAAHAPPPVTDAGAHGVPDGAGHASEIDASDRGPAAVSPGPAAAGGDHWSSLDVPADWEQATTTPTRTLTPQLPPSRFAGSHWIILDEAD